MNFFDCDCTGCVEGTDVEALCVMDADAALLLAAITETT